MKTLTQNSLFACVVLAALAQTAGATTIIQSTGNSEASVPLGYYAPYAPSMTPIVFAVGWTQSTTYTNVDVTANLFTPGSPGTVDYELVTALGAGTSFAADGIAEGAVTTPTNPADVLLFQLASLQVGTYYLVLSSPVADTSWQYNFPGAANDTTASGVTYLGSQWSYGSSIDTTYAPASSFSGVNFPVEFAVTGTVATPEPATFGCTAAALLCVALWFRRRLSLRTSPLLRVTRRLPSSPQPASREQL